MTMMGGHKVEPEAEKTFANITQSKEFQSFITGILKQIDDVVGEDGKGLWCCPPHAKAAIEKLKRDVELYRDSTYLLYGALSAVLEVEPRAVKIPGTEMALAISYTNGDLAKLNHGHATIVAVAPHVPEDAVIKVRDDGSSS